MAIYGKSRLSHVILPASPFREGLPTVQLCNSTISSTSLIWPLSGTLPPALPEHTQSETCMHSKMCTSQLQREGSVQWSCNSRRLQRCQSNQNTAVLFWPILEPFCRLCPARTSGSPMPRRDLARITNLMAIASSPWFYCHALRLLFLRSQSKPASQQ